MPAKRLGATALRIEDTDARVTYSGSWATLSNSAYTNGTTHYSNTTGSRASLTFTGVGLTIKALSTQAADRGLAKIYVDGVFKTSVDMYSPSANLAYTLYDTGVLADGQHTLVIEVSGLKNGSSWGTAIDVDCFDVAGDVTDSGTLSAPTNLTVSSATAGALTLGWTASPESDVTGYNVYRCLTSGGTYQLVNQVAGATSYADTTVQAGTTYYYKISAFDAAANQSALTSAVSGTAH